MSKFRIRPSDEMWPAMHSLKARGIRFRVVSPHHIKIGEINYWPRTGRLYVDGDAGSTPNQTLAAFLNFVAERHQARAFE